MKISEELRDRLLDVLQQAASTWYDDPYGPWGYACQFCGARSTDGSSPPPHDDDCEVTQLVRELMNLPEDEELEIKKQTLCDPTSRKPGI